MTSPFRTVAPSLVRFRRVPLRPVTLCRVPLASPVSRLTSTGRASGTRDIPAGFTLVEMLVSLAITLIMMGAVVTIFGLMGDSVSGSRAIIETAERHRAAQNRLQLDLEGVTATMQPPLRPEEDEGYFEVVEGPATDSDPVSDGNPLPMPAWKTLLGDSDDVLMMTVRSKGEPFVGRYEDTSTSPSTIVAIQSQVAEVIWFTRPDGPVLDAAAIDPSTGAAPRLRTLYRRVLLVMPPVTAPATIMDLDFFQRCDISARHPFPGTTPARMAFNTLGDLTKRENRYGHNPGFTNPDSTTNDFPFPATSYSSTLWGSYPRPQLIPLGTTRIGEDVILSNVLGFDVKVYDPGAPVMADASGKALVPGDRAYGSGTIISYGAYVDPGYMYTPAPGAPTAYFTDSARSPITNTPRNLAMPRVYDTWSLHYEQNGINEDNDGFTDEGRNGLDDDTSGAGHGVVDDPGEAETSPPYPSRLRGIQVKIRVYEPDSQAVREVTVVQDFLPE